MRNVELICRASCITQKGNQAGGFAGRMSASAINVGVVVVQPTLAFTDTYFMEKETHGPPLIVLGEPSAATKLLPERLQGKQRIQHNAIIGLSIQHLFAVDVFDQAGCFSNGMGSSISVVCVVVRPGTVWTTKASFVECDAHFAPVVVSGNWNAIHVVEYFW